MAGHNGSRVGNVGFVPAEVGEGMSLSGPSSGISVPDGPGLNFGAGADFSIEAWVQPVVASTTYGVMDIVDKRITPYYYDDSHSLGYSLCLVNGQLELQMSDSLASSPLNVGFAGPDMRDGAWHHVAVAVQRASTTGGKLYVDGQVVATFDPTSKPGDLTTTAALLIGMHPSPWLDCNFRGGIDEPSLYNVALSAPQISTIYSKGPLGKPSRPCVAPPSGLVAWWPMDGTAADAAGANNGILVGNATFAASEVAVGLNMTGPSSGITVPDASQLDFGAGADFSIEGWINPLSVYTTYSIMDIVDKRITVSDSSTKGYELCLLNGGLGFQMSDSTSGSPLNVGPSGPDLRDGAWHHVAVAVQRASTTGGNLYVDGQLVATFDPTTKSGDLTTTAALLIAMHPSPWLDCNFRGTIDEVSLYNRALTQAEIVGIYTAFGGGKCRADTP